MSISIHHGPNGSYKTSGVVQDYAIPAIKAGRLIVTNIRGLTRENVLENFPDAHVDLEIINIPTHDKELSSKVIAENRHKIATFWHWCPLGALILIDEAGVLFPKRWRQADLDKLSLKDYGDLGRPETFNEAFEMHRHYNWDIVLSAPNISLLRQDIRATTEGAYKHRNNKTLGLGRSYAEGYHNAETNGSKPSDFITILPKKIKPITFKLYKSTVTDNYQDTIAGTSVFKNGKLLFLLAIISIVIFRLGYRSITDNADSHDFTENAVEIIEDTRSDNAFPVQNAIPSLADLVIPDVSSINVNQVFHIEPFYQFQFTIVASLSSQDSFLYFFQASKEGQLFNITSNELKEAGYSVIRISDCSATIVFKQVRRNSICGSKINQINKKFGGVGA